METAIIFFAAIIVTGLVVWLLFRKDLNKIGPLQAENAHLKAELARLTDRDPKTGQFIK